MPHILASANSRLPKTAILLASVLLTLLASASFPAAAQAPRGIDFNFSVNSVDDAVDADPGDGLCETDSGACTLRAAVMEANANPGAHARIELHDDYYLLSLTGPDEDGAATGDLDIHVEMTIAGDPSAAIDGLLSDRIFDVHKSAGNVTLRYLELINGSVPDTDGFGAHGGAIQSYADLTLSDVNIYSSRADDGFGGAILSGGSLHISFSGFYSNHSGFGGGAIELLEAATGEIEHSFFGANESEGGGGAIHTNGVLSITNSTITANTAASGGGISAGSPALVTVKASTIAANAATLGSDIAHDDGAEIQFHSTIIDGTEASCRGFGTLTSLGWNIEASTSCEFDQPTDAPSTDPDLLALSNGGPTPTLPLAPDSPAINFVPVGQCEPFDQRYINRPAPDNAGPTCDAGAYEFGTAWFIVDSTEDGVDSDPGDGYCASEAAGDACTLRAAVQETNALAGADVIQLPEAGPYLLTIPGADEDEAATGDLDILESIVLSSTATPTVGHGRLNLPSLLDPTERGAFVAPVSTIDGGGLDRVLDISLETAETQAIIYGVVIRGGAPPSPQDAGGGIQVSGDGKLHIQAVDFVDNQAGFGGGLATSAPVSANQLRFYDNSAQLGGGLFVASSDVSFLVARFDGNDADYGGGFFNAGELSLSLVALIGNEATTSGGGFHNAGLLDAENVTATLNTAPAGAGMSNDHGDLTELAEALLNNVTIARNTASTEGGGVTNAGAGNTLQLLNSIVAENSAPSGPDCTGVISSLGYNLIGSSESCAIVTGDGDVVDAEAYLGDFFDPIFAIFPGYYGALALLAESPALDGGSPAPTDEPGGCASLLFMYARPEGPACDMGSFEMIQGDLSVELEAAPNPVQVGGQLTLDFVLSTIEFQPATLLVEFSQNVQIVSTPANNCLSQPAYFVCPFNLNSISLASSVVQTLSAGELIVQATLLFDAPIPEAIVDLDPTDNSDSVSITVEAATTATPTITPSQTPSVTGTPTPTATASGTPSVTPSGTPSVTPSATASGTPSATASSTPSVTPSVTPTLPPAELFEGWNPIDPWIGSPLNGVQQIISYLNTNLAPPVWESVARYEGQWLQTFRQAPLPSFNTLTQISTAGAYWLFVTDYSVLSWE